MTVSESDIRKLCTDAVFERAEQYRDEDRIHRLTRFGDTVTASVFGTYQYEVTIDLSADQFNPSCTCPYDGPGECKHVGAVLLELTDGLPADDEEQVNALLSSVTDGELRNFVHRELARDSSMRERFFAQFGDPDGKSVEEYRAEIDRFFEQHTRDSPVILQTLSFSRFTDLAERYRERGAYQQAAMTYCALADSIDANMDLVDAACDHYFRAFRSALDAYVDCISAADLDPEDKRAHVEFLSERANSGRDYFQPYYTAALENLHTGEEGFG